KPCGLGARDTLRLEARLALYGNDIDQTTTPLEAGLGWVVKLENDFIGHDALVAQKQAGVTRKLVGFVMKGRGIAPHHYARPGPARAGGGKGAGRRPPPEGGRQHRHGLRPHHAVGRRHRPRDRLSRQADARRGGRRSVLQESQSMSVDYPDDLKYTREHEWA